MAKGLDYAFGPHPTTAALKSAGFTFVCRYISSLAENDHNGKNLLAAEKNALHSAGISVVLVAEEGSSRMLSGKSAGTADAEHADAVAKGLGMAGIPIYFACDFDATPAQQTQINAYLDGAASVIGRARVGIYGGYYPVKRALDAGKAQFAWQAAAWSGGQWDQRAHIRQTLNGAKVGGASVDYDVSEKADFGQWPRPGQAAKPGTPAKKPAAPTPAKPVTAAPAKPAAPPAAKPVPKPTTATSDQFASPLNLAVVSKTLVLQWDAVSLNGKPAESYTVQAVGSSGDISASVTATSASATLPGLRAGKYEIRVWANGGKVAPAHASLAVTV